MNNLNIDLETRQIVSDRNSKTALDVSTDTRDKLMDRITHLELVVTTMGQKVDDLDRKYNLMLTARFDGKSTVVE